MNIINPSYFKSFDSSLFRLDGFGDVEKRSRLRSAFDKIKGMFNHEFFYLLIEESDIEYGFDAGTFIFRNKGFFSVGIDPAEEDSEQTKKYVLGRKYSKLKNRVGLKVNYCWVAPEYRNRKVGTDLMLLLMDLAKHTDCYLWLCPRPSFYLSFPDIYQSAESKIKALQNQSDGNFYKEKEIDSAELEELYKWYLSIGFKKGLPKIKHSITGFFDPPLIYND